MSQSREIQVRGPEGEFTAYLAVPEKPNGVAIVVLQEIFGVNANIRAIADGFANEGYTAVAPDLFWRLDPGIQLNPASEPDREKALGLMKQLDRDQAIADSTAALWEARNQVTGLVRTAAIGYCFGGGVAYLMATRGVVDAGVAYYGTGLHTLLSEMAAPKGRLLLHIAGDDYLCPAEAQQEIVRAAAQAGAEVIVHPSVGHAFARIGGDAYDREAANRANSATMALLASLVPHSAS